MTQLNHSIFSQIVRLSRSNDLQVSSNTWLNQWNSIGMHFREGEEAHLEEDSLG